MRKCSLPFCDRKHFCNDLCNWHQQQMRLYGEIRWSSAVQGNFYLEDGDSILIALGRHYRPIHWVRIDTEDKEKVLKYHWYCDWTGYAYGEIDGRKVAMHRLIMGFPKHPLQVDHKYGNKLDNRKSQLRVVSQSVNQLNKRRPQGKNRIRGVHKQKDRNLWYAHLEIKGKKVLGKFCKTFEEACRLRKQVERKYLKNILLI